ncbi:hypothetical protein KR018_001907 [Drosophila ironensis]|nr:hypothetical protein KR018_001907 [Drosophila ironensis]
MDQANAIDDDTLTDLTEAVEKMEVVDEESTPKDDDVIVKKNGVSKGQGVNKRKKCLRKPILPWLQGKSSAEAREWINNNVIDDDQTFGDEISETTSGATENESGFSKDDEPKTPEEPQGPEEPEGLEEPSQKLCKFAQTDDSDEVNISELTGYFDDMVTIPKEMSPMAEMMYN